MLKKLKNLFPQKGSVLVFSLIILSFMLVSALSVALVSVADRQSASTTERSSRSFQVADSGVEKLLQKIYKGSSADLNALATSAGGSCASGVISGTTASGSYKISLYDNTGTQLTNCASTTWRDDVVRLKSEGASGNTTRAVEVAVAAAGKGLTGGCRMQSTYEGFISGACGIARCDFTNIDSNWGDGCKTGHVTPATYDCNSASIAASGYECGPTYMVATTSGSVTNTTVYCLCVAN